MSYDADDAAFAPPMILAEGLAKHYRLYQRPIDRLWQFLWRSATPKYQDFTALEGVNLVLRRGEVLGIVGVNGAGKSTLLQLVTGTLPPSHGTVRTHGRIAAILELGSGFNPEFSGRENIYLNAATLGLTRAEIDARVDAIIDFAGIGVHIDQPVKTYSSGMLVRLAFSIATSVDPDILIIDEALSVGDGAFRRQSFDRIMEIKARGATILFCSHVLFHVEAFCDRALWLHRGRVQMLGQVAEVLKPYQEFLDAYTHDPQAQPMGDTTPTGQALTDARPANTTAPQGDARMDAVEVRLDGQLGVELHGTSLVSQLDVTIRFSSDPGLPCPTAAIVLSSESGKILGSYASLTQGVVFERNASGAGTARIRVPRLALNKGRYRVGAYLFCERGMHGYGMFDPAAHITLAHAGAEAGALLLHGSWDSGNDVYAAATDAWDMCRQLPARDMGLLFERLQLAAASTDPRVGQYALECNNPQTLCFLIDAYPTLQRIFQTYPRMGSVRLLDIGPAFGAAGGLLSQLHGSHFLGPRLEVDALDIVDSRREFMALTYPHVNFIHADLTNLPQDTAWDVVYCSNTIEHTDAPRAFIAKVLQHTRGQAVFLAPYREAEPLSLDHRIQVSEDTFEGFTVLESRVFETPAWPATAEGVQRQQILVVLAGTRGVEGQ